jgi:ribonuclease Z
MGEKYFPITVTLLGTSAPTLNPERFTMSTLITAGKKQFIVDAGRGAVLRLSQLNPGQETESFALIDRVLLTHLHFDHLLSLDDLWLSRWMNARRQEPLQMWGPTGTKSFVDHMTSAYEADILYRLGAAEALGFEGFKSGVTILTTEIMEDGVIYEEDGIKITAFAVDHGMPALGYRIDYEDKSVVISGDTTYSPNLIQYAQGADLLLHEVFDFSSEYEDFPVLPEILRWHTTPEQAAAVFNLTKPKLAVYIHIGTLGNVPISDFIDRTKEHYDGPVILGEDLMTITIADKVEVIP